MAGRAGRWVADRNGLAELNTVQITTPDNRPVPELAHRIGTELREVCTQIGDYGERVPSFRFHGGSEVRGDEAGCSPGAAGRGTP